MYDYTCRFTKINGYSILSVEIPDVPSVHLENWPVFKVYGWFMF